MICPNSLNTYVCTHVSNILEAYVFTYVSKISESHDVFGTHEARCTERYLSTISPWRSPSTTRRGRSRLGSNLTAVNSSNPMILDSHLYIRGLKNILLSRCCWNYPSGMSSGNPHFSAFRDSVFFEIGVFAICSSHSNRNKRRNNWCAQRCCS